MKKLVLFLSFSLSLITIEASAGMYNPGAMGFLSNKEKCASA